MRRRALLVAAGCLFAPCLAVSQAPRYGIGRAASQQELRKRAISVAPDGAGLPLGRGTTEEGRRLYKLHCENCHGDKGQGVGDYRALAGGQGTVGSKAPVLTVGSYWPYATTLWDYTRRAMPYQRPGTLSPAEVYAVTAYVLYMNGILEERAALDEKTLPKIKMPNRDGFVPDPRPDVVKNVSQHSKTKP
jgi:S-disulfanyl-L-cysteine oxidoreductase SoxD